MSGHAEERGAPPAVDHRRLLAEIDAEVRARRDEGDFPPEFERELDALFNRFAPPSISDDFDAVLDRADQHAFIDADAPVASRLPGGTLVKKVLRKLMAFYVQHVARNVTAFASTIVRAVRLLGGRVERLEATVPGASRRVLDAYAALPRTDLSGWTSTVAELLGGVTGRVAVVECGDGGLLRTLVARGLDAYGVEPDVATADELADGGLEVRTDDGCAHLRRVPDDALGGLVLVGCVERLPLGALLELAELGASRVAPGGRLLVVSAGPRPWVEGANVVGTDLAPARPLHAATWEHLLRERGISGLEVRLAEPAGDALQLVPGDDPAAKTLNANLARLNEVLFAPASYVVVGTRPRAT